MIVRTQYQGCSEFYFQQHADGSRWLLGHSLWRLQGDTWKPISLRFSGDLKSVRCEERPEPVA